eukprot:TRINITY_DN303_c0_g1_i1.p2 TRINITY_DN303_c0_g1~~TRINITY_DN303_c0_g1_i1.p2  ORF type:complete len:187 (+),score=28.34 TRINITY_DN303_c0_g1_i1:128-688(+)
MTTVIVYCHPRQDSYNHAILEEVTKHLTQKKEKFVIRDLYAMKFNPIDYQGQNNDDIAVEQKIIKEAKHLIFITPVYWYSVSAMMKGYIDRIFAYGFAYEFTKEGPKGLLSHIDLQWYQTTGNTEQVYKEMGFKDGIINNIDKGVFGMCGITKINRVWYHGIQKNTPDERKALLTQVAHHLDQVRK